MVQHALCQESGNIVLLKDLSNLVAKTKNKAGNNIDSVVNVLMEKYGECRIETIFIVFS